MFEKCVILVQLYGPNVQCFLSGRSQKKLLAIYIVQFNVNFFEDLRLF